MSDEHPKSSAPVDRPLETALEEQRAFLEKAQEVAHIGSWIAELDGSDRLTWSREMYRLLGKRPDEKPTRQRALAEYVHPDDQPALRTSRDAAIAAGRPFELEHRIVRNDGTVLWVHTRGELVRDANGNPLRMVGTMQDITERRELEDQLRQSQKLEAIGRLAGGIAHDLNNALTVIIGYAELVTSALAEPDPVRRDVQEIRHAAERAEAVTRQLLAFSRRQWLEPRVFDLGEVIEALGRMLGRLLGTSIDFGFIVEPDLPPIYGDHGQIEQAVLNLAINARDAMPGGGRLTIRAASVDLDQNFVRAHPPMLPGRYVELSVADTGEGMSPETLAHVFEPFFTTKDVGKGTGLGLAMVYGTMKQSGGLVLVESELGQGTVFRLFFPPAVPATTPQEALASDHDQRKVVLIVEDETAVGNLIESALGTEGYRILRAESGVRALQLAADSDRLDVLLTEAVMPDISGVDLAGALVGTRPDLRVVMMATSAPEWRLAPHLERASAILPKPFTPSDLRAKIHDVLLGTNRLR